jgi:hypothetical protein
MHAYLKIAGIFAGFVVILGTLLLTPNASWDAATVVSILSLGASVSLMIMMPKELVGNDSSQRAVISSIGTAGVVLFGYFTLAVISVVIAFCVTNRQIVWVAAIVSIGWAVVGILICRGSVSYVDSRPRHVNSLSSRLSKELASLAHGTSEDSKKDIEELSELIRFSATAVTQEPLRYDQEIEELISRDLVSTVQSGDTAGIQTTLMEIKKRIAAREQHLHAELQRVYKV